ncbi:MAG: hypothetical protein WDO15_08625 [Bacteroidota bacterium]
MYRRYANAQRLRSFATRRNNRTSQFTFSSFRENYLNGTFENGEPAGGRIQYVRILSAIAVLILLVACINFMNLATARDRACVHARSAYA